MSLEKTNESLVECVSTEKQAVAPDGLYEARKANPPKPFSKLMIKLYAFCLVGFLCSSMNGYDGSLMGNLLVLTPFQRHFGSEVDGSEAALVTAMYQMGSVCALPFIAQSMDWKGRRCGMFLGCLFVVIGTIIQGISASVTDSGHSKGMYYAGRFLLGFGVSMASSAAPTYIIEVAHPAYRGTLTGLYNIQYNIGAIVAAGACRGSMYYDDNRAWTIPTWVQMVMPGFVVAFAFFLPETPRWKYSHGQKQEAIDFMIKYHGDNDPENSYVTLQLAEFEDHLALEGADKRWWDYRILFNSHANRYRVGCNIVFAIIPQFAVGGMGYYSGAFLKACGITDPVAVMNYNLGVSFINPFVGYTAASFCDVIGRRVQFLGGLAFIVFCWIIVTPCTAAVSDHGNLAAGRAAMAFSTLSGVGYTFGFTPLQALYPVEVLSYEMRAKGMAFNSFVLSAVLLINQFAAPIALEKIGWKYFIVIVCWDVFQFICAYFFLIETRGYTLEELDDIFAAPYPLKASLQGLEEKRARQEVPTKSFKSWLLRR